MTTADEVRAIEAEARAYRWPDAQQDLEKLEEIAFEHSPDGVFQILDSVHFPDDYYETNDPVFSYRFSPTFARWFGWLIDKYGRWTAQVVNAKFLELLFPDDIKMHARIDVRAAQRLCKSRMN